MSSAGSGAVLEVGEIERRVTELWRESSGGDQALVRACTLNLIVPCEDAVEAGNAVARLSEHHPCRAIVVSCGSASETRVFQAWVVAHCHRGLGGRPTCSEQITLEARGDAISLVPDTVLQLLCEDLPVCTWWSRPTLANDPLLAPLARLSDRILIDSSAFTDPVQTLAVLATDPSLRGCVEDLTWTRLEPWRGLVASLFDAPSTRPLLGGVLSVSVVAGGPASADGHTVAGAYLAGWLASRLGFTIERRRVLRADGREVTIRLEHDPALGRGEIGSVRMACRVDDLAAQVNAARADASSDLVRSWVEMERMCPLPRVLKLPARDPIALLSREIEKETKDPVFLSALPCAARLTGSIS